MPGQISVGDLGQNYSGGNTGTYTFEVAEEKQSEVLLIAKVEEHPLRVEVERV